MITPTTHKQIEITAFPIFFTHTHAHAHHQRSCCTIYLTSPSLLVNSSIVQLISFETSMDSCSGRNSNVHLILRKSKRNQNDFFSFLHINVAGMHLEPLLITLTSDCIYVHVILILSINSQFKQNMDAAEITRTICIDKYKQFGFADSLAERRIRISFHQLSINNN